MRVITMVLSAIALVAAGAFAAWAVLERTHKAEPGRQAEEHAAAEPAVSRTEQGEVLLYMEEQDQRNAGIELSPLESVTYQLTRAAFGKLIEDPAESFAVRAPLAGILRAVPDQAWPVLGQQFEAGQTVALIQPRLSPVERVDLNTRLLEANSTATQVRSELDAARASYEGKRRLSEQAPGDQRAISLRSVEEAKARFDALEARLRAAQQAITLIEQSLAAQAGATPELVVPRPGQVIELTAQAGETIEAGQPVLRMGRFDRLLARVQLPIGEFVQPAPTHAEIQVVGQEHPLVGALVLQPAQTAAVTGQEFVYRVESVGNGLRPGAPVIARLPLADTPLSGVLVPRSALVRFADRAWVYVRRDADHFVRRAVAVDKPAPSGWVVTDGLKPGDEIATTGAQVLLATEAAAQTGGAEE